MALYPSASPYIWAFCFYKRLSELERQMRLELTTLSLGSSAVFDLNNLIIR